MLLTRFDPLNELRTLEDRLNRVFSSDLGKNVFLSLQNILF